ncbi:MAG: DMT family transporter [Phycisphaerales bacterium JB065]
MQSILLITLAAAAGMILPLQPGINSQLQSKLGSAWVAALVSFTVGTLTLLSLVSVLRFSTNPSILPSMNSIRTAPWWAWLGGLIGAVFVSSSIILAPKLGAVLFIGAVVFGQMISSTLLDHFGIVGYSKQPTNPGRLIGIALILAGVVLIQRSSSKPRHPEPTPDTALPATATLPESTPHLSSAEAASYPPKPAASGPTKPPFHPSKHDRHDFRNFSA